jgi:hypothetical protein
VFEGWEVVAAESGGHAVRFRLIVGPDFVARALEVDADGPHGLRRLSVRRAPKGQWWVNGQRRSDLDPSLDVDIAATPLTNTPTINRLDLAPGEVAEIAVAWVDAPSLTIALTEQRYERLPVEAGDERRYRFTSGAFEAVITTDSDGLVRDYQGFAERVFRR